MNIAVIGTGYVGLVTGACLAQQEHEVTCVDKDIEKIERLNNGEILIYEPGLKEIVQSSRAYNDLSFTTNIQKAIEENDVIFICVGTPQGEGGKVDLSAVWDVVDDIKMVTDGNKTIIIKSTVPVGTNAEIFKRLDITHLIVDNNHRVISNPEFLREGSAIYDCQNPSRIVVGSRNFSDDLLFMKRLYKRNYPFVVVSPESAELTKYASNGFLATKISYMNEIANLCEKVGADIEEVKEGMGYDDRIGAKFLNAGCGYGGSCFPKDGRALIHMAAEYDIELEILPMVEKVNEEQKQVLIEKLLEIFDGNIRGKMVAVWGLAFKPGTDDIREAPSCVVLRQLWLYGANVRVHDPQAMPNMKKLFVNFDNVITYCEDKMDAVEGAGALLILTEWDEYKKADIEEIKKKMENPIIIDGRNIFNPSRMEGFLYASIGRKTVDTRK